MGIVDDNSNMDKLQIGCKLKAVLEFYMLYKTDYMDKTMIKFAVEK